MLAGNITGRGRIELVDVADPRLSLEEHGPGKIVFQPECGCLCGSDLPFFECGDISYTPGIGQSLHELVGSVVATTGSRFSAGDRVLCIPVEHYGLSERFIVDEQRAIPLDPRVPREHALMAQPLGTVIFALKKLPPVLDLDVAVVGQGPMGQLFNAALRNLGAREIIAIDPLQSRLDVSPAMGATSVVCNADHDAVKAVEQLTDGRMPDLVIEVVGHEEQALNLCIDLCRPAGRILYFGVPPSKIDGIRWRDLFFKNITIHTSVNPDLRRDFPLAMRWIGEGRINVSRLITHRFPLADIQKAFETFRDRTGGAIKVLVDFPAASRTSG